MSASQEFEYVNYDEKTGSIPLGDMLAVSSSVSSHGPPSQQAGDTHPTTLDDLTLEKVVIPPILGDNASVDCVIEDIVARSPTLSPAVSNKYKSNTTISSVTSNSTSNNASVDVAELYSKLGSGGDSADIVVINEYDDDESMEFEMSFGELPRASSDASDYSDADPSGLILRANPTPLSDGRPDLKSGGIPEDASVTIERDDPHHLGLGKTMSSPTVAPRKKRVGRVHAAGNRSESLDLDGLLETIDNGLK